MLVFKPPLQENPKGCEAAILYESHSVIFNSGWRRLNKI